MQFGMYRLIMAFEPILTAYFINPTHQYVCSYVYPIVDRQMLGKHVTTATNTRNNRRIVGSIILYTVSVLSDESRLLVLPRISRYFYFIVDLYRKVIFPSGSVLKARGSLLLKAKLM
jgi:hypothetical protein